MTPPHGMRIVTSEHVPSGVALLFPDGGGIVAGALTLDMPLWAHDGPFWRQTPTDPALGAAARREALHAEDHLARVVDAAWLALGWDPAVWRSQRAAETRAARDRARYWQAAVYAGAAVNQPSASAVIANL